MYATYSRMKYSFLGNTLLTNILPSFLVRSDLGGVERLAYTFHTVVAVDFVLGICTRQDFNLYHFVWGGGGIFTFFYRRRRLVTV